MATESMRSPAAVGEVERAAGVGRLWCKRSWAGAVAADRLQGGLHVARLFMASKTRMTSMPFLTARSTKRSTTSSA